MGQLVLPEGDHLQELIEQGKNKSRDYLNNFLKAALTDWDLLDEDSGIAGFISQRYHLTE